jgi:hypothetical protein
MNKYTNKLDYYKNLDINKETKLYKMNKMNKYVNKMKNL